MEKVTKPESSKEHSDMKQARYRTPVYRIDNNEWCFVVFESIAYGLTGKFFWRETATSEGFGNWKRELDWKKAQGEVLPKELKQMKVMHSSDIQSALNGIKVTPKTSSGNNQTTMAI